MKNVVVIGGGTGTYTVLSGLKEKKYNLTALLTMVDDGGSNRVLRDEFGLLPTSGVRLAMVALSSKPSLLRELFMYRYSKGTGLAGMTFGNLFLAAVTDIVGSQEKAIEQTCEILSVKGKVLPISYEDVRLVAHYENGLEVVGEHHIDEPTHDGKLHIERLDTRPEATISDHAKQAIMEADAILLGPGDLYTNTIANLVIKGVPEALEKSKAKIVFVGNLMTKYGETYGYKASDYLKDLGKYMKVDRLDAILLNSDTKYPEEALKVYEEEHSIPVEDDLNKENTPKKTKVYREKILSKEVIKPQKGDVLKRSIIRHDPEKLAEAISKII